MKKETLFYLWQLPQNLLGLLVRAVMGVKQEWTEEDKPGIIFCYGTRMRGGISLGKYVIVQYAPFHRLMPHMVLHEYGHTKQSRLLGPLYLLVVGIPSLLWALWSSITPFASTAYYKMPIEYWADKAGGVDREARAAILRDIDNFQGTRRQRVSAFALTIVGLVITTIVLLAIFL